MPVILGRTGPASCAKSAEEDSSAIARPARSDVRKRPVCIGRLPFVRKTAKRDIDLRSHLLRDALFASLSRNRALAARTSKLIYGRRSYEESLEARWHISIVCLASLY